MLYWAQSVHTLNKSKWVCYHPRYLSEDWIRLDMFFIFYSEKFSRHYNQGLATWLENWENNFQKAILDISQMWLMICIGNAQIEYSSSLNIEFIIYKRYF